MAPILDHGTIETKMLETEKPARATGAAFSYPGFTLFESGPILHRGITGNAVRRSGLAGLRNHS